MAQQSARRDRDNQAATPYFEYATLIWTRSANSHAGRRSMAAQRPDRWQHPTTRHGIPDVFPCPEGGVHRCCMDTLTRLKGLILQKLSISTSADSTGFLPGPRNKVTNCNTKPIHDPPAGNGPAGHTAPSAHPQSLDAPLQGTADPAGRRLVSALSPELPRHRGTVSGARPGGGPRHPEPL